MIDRKKLGELVLDFESLGYSPEYTAICLIEMGVQCPTGAYWTPARVASVIACERAIARLRLVTT